MEVTKRYPLLSMYQRPGDGVSLNSLTRSSHSWFEWVNRRLYKKPEVQSQFCFLEGPYSSVVPIWKVLGTPEEPIVYYCPTEMTHYNDWKSTTEHLKLPLTHPALPDPCMASENKSRGILNSFVRELTQKVLSVCHLQHFCDLVSGLVNTVSVSHNMLMASKNSPNVTKMTLNNLTKSAGKLGFCESVSAMTSEAGLNVMKMSENDNLEKHTIVEAGNLVLGFCESVSVTSSENILNPTSTSAYNSFENQAAVKAENLRSGFCESVSIMPSKNTQNMSKVSQYDGKDAVIKAGNLKSGLCESVTTIEVGYCSDCYQSDSKDNIPEVNCTVVDVTTMNNSRNFQNSTSTENLVPVLNVTEVEECNANCQDNDRKSAAMMNDLCHNSPAREMRSGVRTKLNVDQEMVSRKQRRINKHSKKRKRRMRKKQKIYSAPSHEKTGRKVPSSASSQIKSRSGLCASVGSSVVSPDWEDSDDDLCIVFDDEVDGAHCSVPKTVNSQSAIIKESCDLWIEFDSLTIVPGSGSTSMDCRSYSSEISFQYDSDSDAEYETDSGQIFVDTDDFDSFSGLVFLNGSVDGCSGLPSLPYVHCQSFTSCTTSYEQVNDCVGLYEVNKRWQEVMSDINGKPRLPQRVTFAPEEELVEVFPVDIIDRKSEWEQFALERFRFKRRIDEFEKIIAPYLTSAHREKTFRRLTDAAS